MKYLDENNFKNLSQESYSKVLDLVKQKRLYPYDKCPVLESLIKHFLAKNEFYSWLSGKGISDKEYQHVLKFWNNIETKTIKDYHDLYLKCNVSMLADVFEKVRKKMP